MEPALALREGRVADSRHRDTGVARAGMSGVARCPGDNTQLKGSAPTILSGQCPPVTLWPNATLARTIDGNFQLGRH